MGKHKDDFQYTVVDPKTLRGTEWPEVEKALRLFTEATTEVKQLTIRRSSLKDRADMTVFGFLLLCARIQYGLREQEEAQWSAVAAGRSRGSRGQFQEEESGFYKWLDEAFPGICRSSAKNYMNLARNLGFVPGMPPDYLDDNVPVLKKLRGRLKDLYKSPSTYQDEQRLKELRRTKQTPSLELKYRVSFRDSLEVVRNEISRMKVCARHADPDDLNEFTALLQGAAGTCEKMRKGTIGETCNA